MAWNLFRRRPPGVPSDLDVNLKARVHDPQEGDLQVLDALRSAGSRMDKVHVIDFNFIVRGDGQLQALREALRGRGTVDDEKRGRRHALTLHESLVPTPEAIRQRREELTRLASELGADFDGWGAAIVEH